MVVICNGLLCQGSKYLDLPYQRKLMIYDVVCNMIMGMFMMYTAEYQIVTTIIFTISVYNFILNKLKPRIFNDFLTAAEDVYVIK